MSNLRSKGHMQPRMAVNAAQQKILNLLKTLWDYFVIMCHNVFNVWPKITLFPVWCRDTKRLDTPALDGIRIVPELCYSSRVQNFKIHGAETHDLYITASWEWWKLFYRFKFKKLWDLKIHCYHIYMLRNAVYVPIETYT